MRRLMSIMCLASASACLAAPGEPRDERASDAAPAADDADGAAPPADAGENPLLLHLAFDDATQLAEGPAPTDARDIDYVDGLDGGGAHLVAPARLTYPAAVLRQERGTIALWIRPDWAGDDGLNHHMVTWGEVGGLGLLKDGGNYLKIILNRLRPTDDPYPETGAVAYIADWSAGDWHHVAATWSPEDVRLYVDGEYHSGGPMQPLAPAAAEVAIGDDVGTYAGQRYADGVLDDLRFYSIALTADEIEALHAELAP